MGQFGAVPVPVLAQGPAAVAVPFPWRVELPALGALPAILRDLRQKFQQEKKKKKISVFLGIPRFSRVGKAARKPRYENFICE